MTAAPYQEQLEGWEPDDEDVHRIADVIAHQNIRIDGEPDAACYARIARAVLDEFYTYELMDPAWQPRPTTTVDVAGERL